jgi:alkylresorcinol/alkylpyrone synthase
VELCGQIFSPKATDPVDAVGCALFGDGAAAVLLGGEQTSGTGPQVAASGSALFEDTQHIMGWRFTSDGMRLVLAKEITNLLREKFKPATEGFLAEHGMTLDDISHWILHPGGRRIIEAYESALGSHNGALSWTRSSLAKVGNLSSASVLFVLEDVLQGAALRPGDRAFLAAPGPGFGVEMVVLAW